MKTAHPNESMDNIGASTSHSSRHTQSQRPSRTLQNQTRRDPKVMQQLQPHLSAPNACLPSGPNGHHQHLSTAHTHPPGSHMVPSATGVVTQTLGHPSSGNMAPPVAHVGVPGSSGFLQQYNSHLYNHYPTLLDMGPAHPPINHTH